MAASAAYAWVQLRPAPDRHVTCTAAPSVRGALHRHGPVAVAYVAAPQVGRRDRDGVVARRVLGLLGGPQQQAGQLAGRLGAQDQTDSPAGGGEADAEAGGGGAARLARRDRDRPRAALGVRDPAVHRRLLVLPGPRPRRSARIRLPGPRGPAPRPPPACQHGASGAAAGPLSVVGCRLALFRHNGVSGRSWTMTDVLLTAGTRKGLFIGRRRGGTWESPARTSTRRRSTRWPWTPGKPSQDPGRRGQRAWGPVRLPLRRSGRDLGRAPHSGGEVPEGDRGFAGARVAAASGGTGGPGRGLRGHGARGAVPVRGPGESFELVRPLWEHPTRSRWVPGGGGEGLHTVLTDPRDREAVTVAVSTAGVFRTKDGGASWAPSNKGVSAVFLPAPGSGVRPVRPQGHPGRGRSGPALPPEPLGCVCSDDSGDHWSDIGAGLPSDFGFAAVAHPHRGGTAYVFPINADADRVPGRAPLPGVPDERRRAHLGAALRGTAGRGALRHGAPGRSVHRRRGPRGGLLRQPQRRVVRQRGRRGYWRQLASHLPDVLCVRAVALG
ncbi:hypothetical protein SCYAM73S_02859 [Streptomyces cyaneofuscatus]